MEVDFKAPKVNPRESVESKLEIDEAHGMCIDVMRWGMVRADNNQSVINARFEDIMRRPMFRDLLKDFRCIITINGYYEWKNPNDKVKQPYYIFPKEGEVLQLAGLYRPQSTDDGKIINTFVIVTIEALDELNFIHNRMPLVLTEETRKLWLDPEMDFRQVYRKVRRQYITSD